MKTTPAKFSAMRDFTADGIFASPRPDTHVRDITFIQRSRLGRTIFLLRGETLEVTTQTMGRTAAATIPLKLIDSNYDLIAKRSYGLIVIPLTFAGISLWAMCRILMQNVVPADIAMYPAGFFALSVYLALRGVPRLQCFMFSNRKRQLLFEVIREKAQTEECDAFVRELLDRIEGIADPDQPPDRPLPQTSAVKLPDDGETELGGSGGHRWKISIAAGVLSIAVPYLLRSVPAAGGIAFNVVLWGGTTTVISGILSFVARERMRYWSIIGFALALILLFLVLL